jgi:hypothetical protein
VTFVFKTSKSKPANMGAKGPLAGLVFVVAYLCLLTYSLAPSLKSQQLLTLSHMTQQNSNCIAKTKFAVIGYRGQIL